MPHGHPLDYIADGKDACPKETEKDGEVLFNLCEDTHKGENLVKKIFERDTGLKFDKVG